jgi:hypothetical protein
MSWWGSWAEDSSAARTRTRRRVSANVEVLRCWGKWWWLSDGRGLGVTALEQVVHDSGGCSGCAEGTPSALDSSTRLL